MPEGQTVIVQPPALWVRWGLVKPGVTWTLDRAVHGLRESPALWSAGRDKQLKNLRWHDPDTKTEYVLEDYRTDSQ
eukprot:7754041-Pyramimonas_sp.AAC.1